MHCLASLHGACIWRTSVPDSKCANVHCYGGRHESCCSGGELLLCYLGTMCKRTDVLPVFLQQAASSNLAMETMPESGSAMSMRSEP